MDKKKLCGMDIEEQEFFTIEENGGVKNMHVHGYLYYGEGGIKSVECCGAYIDLKEFSKKGLEERIDTILDCVEKAKQCIAEFGERDIVEVANECYKDFEPIHVKNVKEDTKCGTYLMQYGFDDED